MKAKRSVFVVAVCVGVVGLSATLCATSISPINWKGHFNWVADGGAPMPPWPKPPLKPRLLADGGAPMPPWPPKQTSRPTLIADGGAPMPPWPTPPSPKLMA
jgi:hypothetical protein